jgi:hypothetical protein
VAGPRNECTTPILRQVGAFPLSCGAGEGVRG